MVKLVGVLNITPDSFSDGGQFVDPAKALAHAEKLFDDGASLLDVGAESTRPNAQPLTPHGEWKRLEPVLPQLLRRYPGKISLDTYHPETAELALQLGDVIINDVTGMQNPRMVEVVVRHKARCIVSYLPESDVQRAHSNAVVDDVQQVVDWLHAKAESLIAAGLPKEKIILDPGIGFGKTPALNAALLCVAKYIPDFPVMIGYSRKRFLGEHRMELEPNLNAGRIAAKCGATYLRVHDVAGHKQLISS